MIGRLGMARGQIRVSVLTALKVGCHSQPTTPPFFACYLFGRRTETEKSTMNRRVACIGLLTLLKASVVSSFALAAQEAAKTVARIAGPRWNVNGDWTPSIEEIQNHLRDAHGIDPSGRDVEDLFTLHDNDHNRRGYSSNHSHKKASKSSSKGYARF